MSKILIVDDSGTMRKIIMRVIRQTGIDAEFEEAQDGLEALDIADAGGIDLILSDINMPNMSGLDFVRHFRAKHGHETPVIMITTEGSDEVIAKATAVGANGYLTKPFTPEMIEQTVQPHLVSREGERK